MIKKESSAEKYDNFINVRFLLVSEMRPRLLLMLLGSNNNLNTLRKELGKPSASVLHGLNELESLNLIKKNFKNYSLSSKGVLYALALKKLFRDLYIFKTHVDFWKSHSIESIPVEYFKSSYLLKDSVFVESDEEDLSRSLNKTLKLLSSCEDMKIILPIFLEDHLEIILENLERDNSLILITTDEVLKSLKESNYYEKLHKFSKNNQLTIRKVEYELKIFLTVCDNAMALNLFFIDGLFDNSCVIFNEKAEGVDWANQLFKFYLKRSNKIL
ncbi:Predicted transcriptional regulator, contains HTH domain [Methanobrevibacter olleyae]|uniref:Predicted transcriptional regulator, contains HTH domain n=1 Tax=Methanobrevibacter olleyae TaxID=294671 RepID=A0A1I4GXF7_METOL|nr:transcriptional regulator FilR1 domain-containing protein [Methanobrevibacter olleyae]SFL34728.1 Predicted transcriptional regulator, contains HTH domain [Methanobrevibacter olleyae]